MKSIHEVVKEIPKVVDNVLDNMEHRQVDLVHQTLDSAEKLETVKKFEKAHDSVAHRVYEKVHELNHDIQDYVEIVDGDKAKDVRMDMGEFAGEI